MGIFLAVVVSGGIPGLPMLSVTMNNGVVTRESLDRKMETNLSDEEHLLVRKGDIVYNMMRMWQGASGLADRDGLLSPAYVVLTPKKGIDPLYASYLFKSSRFIYLFWAYSYGLTADRLRLYFNDFKRIPVSILPESEQRRIGEILLTWDKAIDVTEKLIENSKEQKAALIKQLLTCKIRLREFHEDWHEVTIGSILREVKRPVTWNDKNQYKLLSVKRRCEGVFLREVLYGHQILTKKMNFAHAGDFLISKMQVVHGAMGLVEIEHHGFHVSDSYISLEAKKQGLIDVGFFWWFCNQKLMAHKAYLCSYGVHIEKMTFNLGLFLKEKIFIPKSIDEQKKIAQVLTAADSEIETLQQKLACLKQEKKALMQQLLTGKLRVKVDES